MFIGDFIKEKREKKKCSINKLALLSRVSAAHISRIERGLRDPSPEILERLSKSLDTSYEELMKKAGYIKDEDIKQSFHSNELIDLLPDEYRELFKSQNIGYIDFAKEMLKEEIDPNDLIELIKISKNIRKRYLDNNKNGSLSTGVGEEK